MGHDARIQDRLKPFTIFVPFSGRVDQAERMVYGVATSEDVDSYETVFSIDATREALAEYDQWRTLRGMHDAIAAGTVPILELTDRALHVGAHVVDNAEWEKVLQRVYKGFSIGFDPLDGRFEIRSGREVFVFTKYRLIEISLVDRNSNPTAVITLYRADRFQLADKQADWIWDWQGDAQRILDAGGQALLSQACAWYDRSAPDDDGDGLPDSVGAYALPVAKLASPEDQRLTLNFNGIRHAMAGLNGARDDLQIPDSEREAVYKTLASYFRMFKETPPDYQRRVKEDSMDKDQPNVDAAVEKGIRAFFSRLMGGGSRQDNQDPPAPKPPVKQDPPERVRLEAAAHDSVRAAAESLKALVQDDSPEQIRAASDALEALLGNSERIEPPPKSDLEKRLEDLESQNRDLREKLDKSLAARKSQDTVEGGGKPFKSRYNGVFIS